MAPHAATSQVGGEHRVVHSEARRPIERIVADVIWFIIGFIVVVLLFRFALLLFGANPEAGFTQIIYALSAPFMAPFQAVFGTTAVERSVFEWSALLAVFVYLLIGWGLTSLVMALTPRYGASTVEEVEHVEEDEHVTRTL